jgi:hypothetical protein
MHEDLELVFFLVGLRTYQHPCISSLLGRTVCIEHTVLPARLLILMHVKKPHHNCTDNSLPEEETWVRDMYKTSKLNTEILTNY